MSEEKPKQEIENEAGRAALDALPLFKTYLAEAMKKSPLSRAQIAEEVNTLLRAEGIRDNVTEAKLNKWGAPSDTTHVPPLRTIPFLLLVVGTPAPLNAMLAPLDAAVAGPRERELMRLGQAQVDAKKAAKLKRMAEAALEDLR